MGGIPTALDNDEIGKKAHELDELVKAFPNDMARLRRMLKFAKDREAFWRVENAKPYYGG
jgi:hypothetical protein